MGSGSDLLSLFLQTPDVFTEDVIVDELLDFLVAGTQTTQSVSHIMLSHFATDRQSLSRVRDEFDQVAKEIDFSDAVSLDDKLRKVLTMEACGDMTYLGYVMHEALRISPPAPASSPLYFKEDITLGKYRVKGGDHLLVNFYGLQHSSS